MKGNAMRCMRGREQGKQQEREQEEEHREKQERHAGEVVEGAVGQAAGEAAAPRPGNEFAQRISNSLNALISLINAAILASHGRVPVHIAA